MLVDVKSRTYIDIGVENNNKAPKLKFGNHLITSKHKKIFTKGYAPDYFEEHFPIKRVKITFPWKYVLEGLN